MPVFTVGSIIGIIVGSLVGVFYLYCCFISARKAITDRRGIKTRNRARRKARSFREQHRNPELAGLTEALEAAKNHDNKNGNFSATNNTNLLEAVNTYLHPSSDYHSRKVSIISIDGVPFHDRGPSFLGGGGHIAHAPVPPMNRAIPSVHTVGGGGIVGHQAAQFYSALDPLFPPPPRQSSPLSPLVDSELMNFQLSLDRKTLKRRRSYEIAIDDDDPDSSSTSHPVPKTKSLSRLVPKTSNSPTSPRGGRIDYHHDYRLDDEDDAGYEASHLSRGEGRSQAQLLKGTTPRIHFLRAYNPPLSSPTISSVSRPLSRVGRRRSRSPPPATNSHVFHNQSFHQSDDVLLIPR